MTVAIQQQVTNGGAAARTPDLKLKVFISYSRHDLEFVERLVAGLEMRGIDVLIDRRDLPLLEEWQRELLGFIRQADAIVYVVSPASIGSQWCGWEVSQVAALNKRLAPIVVEPVADIPMPDGIGKVNFLFFTPPNAFDVQLDSLVKALNTDLAWIKEHTRLGERARLWSERGKASALVIRGEELRQAERWIAKRPREAPAPTQLHRDFLNASARAQVRRRRWSIAGAVGTLALMGIAAVLGLSSLEQRELADTRSKEASKSEGLRLANVAQARSDEGDQETALRLALEASQKEAGSSSPEVYAALYSAASRSNPSKPCPSPSGIFQTASFLPPDNRLVTVSSDNTVRVWPAGSCDTPAWQYQHKDIVSAVASSRDGAVLATASWDKTIAVLDTRSGQPRQLLGYAERVLRLALSDDGSRLLAASRHSAKIWDLARAEPIAALADQSEDVVAIAFCGAQPSVVTENNGAYVIRSLAPEKVVARFESINSGVPRAVLAPDCAHIAVLDRNETQLCESSTRTCPKKIGESGATAAEFSADGTRFAVAHDHRVEVWNLSDKKRLAQFADLKNDITRLRISRDSGRVLAADGFGNVLIWDVGSQRSLVAYKMPGASPYDIAFSDSLDRVLTSANEAVQTWPAFTSWSSLKTYACSLNNLASENPACKQTLPGKIE